MRMLFTALLFLALPVHAGTIQWQQVLHSELRDSQVHCSMKLSQTGDDLARAVSVDWEFAGEKESSRSDRDYLPGTVVHTDTAIFQRPALPGWYPVIARLNYADANGYPFSSILVHLQSVDTPPPLRFLIEPAGLTLSRTGATSVRVKYAGDSDVEVTCRVVAPVELDVTEPKSALKLHFRPGQELVIPIGMGTGGALPGTRTTVYIIMEGEQGGIHEVGMGTIQVNVVKPDEGNMEWKIAALAVLAISLALLLQPILRRRKKIVG